MSLSYTQEDITERLDQSLAKKSGYSRMHMKHQIEEGRVTVNGKVYKKASQRVKPGDVIKAEFKIEKPLEVTAVPGKLDILFEDADFLVLNKPQGLVVHPAAGHRGETLVHYLLHHCDNAGFSTLSESRPGIVHRLDRGTSGLILIAKHRKSQDALSRQFKSREIKKEYECIVWGVCKETGMAHTSIGRHPTDRKRMSSKSQTGREAHTEWKRVLASAHFSHVAVFPRTGRTHQIRVHLSEAGFPIVGDAMYGRNSLQKFEDRLSPLLLTALEMVEYTFLHARALRLSHPMTGEALQFEAPRPSNFEKFLTLMRNFDT